LVRILHFYKTTFISLLRKLLSLLSLQMYLIYLDTSRPNIYGGKLIKQITD
jgi:hypothetical protein